MILWSNDYAQPRYRQRVRLRLVSRRRAWLTRLRAWFQSRDPIISAVILTAAAVVAGEWLIYWLVWG